MQGLSTVSMATEKKSFVIRVDTETLAAIEKWAADEFRSTNGQIEWILTDALKRAKRSSLQAIAAAPPPQSTPADPYRSL